MDTFECQVCFEDVLEPRGTIRTIGDDQICSDCAVTAIVPLFEAAIKNEIDYPPKWGSQEIPFEDFRDLLSPAARGKWFKKLAEYKTPVARRVYCGRKKKGRFGSGNEICNFFMGMIMQGHYASCGGCSGDTCLGCRAPAMRGWHECRPANNAKSEFDQAVQGCQWQRCPNVTCGVVVQLSDGCKVRTSGQTRCQ